MRLATIELIENIKTHPNADRLDVATVKEFPVIIQKDSFKNGDKVVFIYPDTVLPEEDWSEAFRKFNPKRVKAQQLRKIWSFGIAVSLDTFKGLEDLECGTEIGDDIGIVKYISPVPQIEGGIGELPFNIPKTDEEMYQNVDIESLIGQKVDITLKIDGSSWTAFCVRDEDEENGFRFGITSRSLEYDKNIENIFTIHNKRYDVENQLVEYCVKNNKSLAIRGEVYGQGIQSSKKNPYSKKELSLGLYNVFNIDTLKYEKMDSEDYVFHLAEKFKMPTVPLIEEGVVLTHEIIDKYLNLKKLNGDYFEGVVISTNEKSFKVINLYYDSNK